VKRKRTSGKRSKNSERKQHESPRANSQVARGGEHVDETTSTKRGKSREREGMRRIMRKEKPEYLLKKKWQKLLGV